MAIQTFSLESPARRAAMTAGAVLCLVFALVAAKWFFGSTLAARAIYKEIADVAVMLAPGDPQAHFTAAVLHEKTFMPEDLPISLAEYDQAVAASPYDFRYWTELGLARSHAGDAPGAEKALRRALEIAPNYARVQWALGNFLLREGRADEAFVEIRRAAEGDRNYAGPAISSAWQLYEGDGARLRQFAGDSPNLKAALALLLAREKRFDESLAVWNEVPAELRRTAFNDIGVDLYGRFRADKRYRGALAVFNSIQEENGKNAAAGRITNGDFELDQPKTPEFFEWNIAEGVEPQIGVDNAVRHGGNLSLKMILNSADANVFRAVTQTVAVLTQKRYAVEGFYRAELKKAAGTLKWEVADAADPAVVLGTSQPIAAESDWAPLRIDFTTPPNAEGVILRLVREKCAANKDCPLTGRVWFDDFSMNEVQ